MTLNKKTHYIVIFIYLIIFNCFCYAFDNNKDSEYQYKRDNFNFPMNIGVFGGINSIKSFAIIPFFPQEFSCGNYEKGSGSGIFLGINYGIMFYNNNIIADLRIFNEKRPSTLEEKSNCYEVLSPVTNEYEISTRKHTYTVNFSYLALDLGIKLRLFNIAADLSKIDFLKKIPIYSRFGFESGQAMFDKTYTNTQEFLTPAEIYFPNGERINTVEEGEYDETISSEAINISLGADFSLAKNIWLSPELTYRYELSPSIDMYNWKTDILRAGISLSIDFNVPDEVKQSENIELKEEVKEEIVAEVKKEEIKRNNIDKFIFNEIDFTETIVTQTFPILPYIFFDSTSSEIRSVYKFTKSEFNEDNLDNNTIGIYYNIINIIANRMKDNPDSKIKLIGSSDGIEKESLNEKLELSLNRAKAIKERIVSYGVSENRITIENRETPKLPTSNKYTEGLQENRRVDIETNNLDLLKPVLHSDFLEYSLKKPLKFETKLKSNKDIDKIELSLSVLGNEVVKETIDNVNSSYVIHNINEKVLSIIASNMDDMSSDNTVKAEIEIFYNDNQIEKKGFDIPVYKEKSSFEVGRLNLIVFDFDKFEISEPNKNMIKQFISSSISENSNTTITGSTDLLGEKIYNKSLSLSRANEVADYIKIMNPKFKISDIIGLGSEQIFFDNNTPEGRFYCRTVLVEVKTPIKTN